MGGEWERRVEVDCHRAALTVPEGIHLAALVSAESTLIGLLVVVICTIVSVFAVLIVTLVNRWQPVMDIQLVALGAGCGMLVGILGALLAVTRSVRVTPVEALRSN